MVVYIYQCYWLNSLYPLFPLLYPQVCCSHPRLYKQGYQSVYRGLGSQWDRLLWTIHPGRCHDHGGPCEWCSGPHAIHSGQRTWGLWAHESLHRLLQEVTPKYHRQDFKQAPQTCVSTRPRAVIFTGPHTSQERARVISGDSPHFQILPDLVCFAKPCPWESYQFVVSSFLILPPTLLKIE